MCSDTLPRIIRDSKELSGYQRKEGGQISFQLNAYKIKKNALTLPTSYNPNIRLLKTHEEDPSVMNAFQKRNFKLLVDLVQQGISYFEKDGSGQKCQCATKSLLLNKQNHLNH